MRNHALILLSSISLIDAKVLWSSTPANYSDILRNAYPVGNGILAAMSYGPSGLETLNLNRDNLWYGGPFENKTYIGGNPTTSVASALPSIRAQIFRNGTGDVSALMGSDDNYGSYSVLGNFTVAVQGVTATTGFKRVLDLNTGVHTSSYTFNGSMFTSKLYCSHPDSVCVYDLASSSGLPEVSISFQNLMWDTSLVTPSCTTSPAAATLDGITQADIGLIYKAEARVLGTAKYTASCTSGVLTIVPAKSQKILTLVIAAGTNYNAQNGNAAANYSFRGADPGPYVTKTVTKAAAKSRSELLSTHRDDFSALMGAFTLDLPDTAHSAGMETADLINRYSVNSSDPFLESLQFDYGRYLFISSSRADSLPPNLQGKWAIDTSNAWSGDYHADINLQMNHWGVDQTGLGHLQHALWEYMVNTWAPRGAETAKLLYDAPGWVVHDEVNIFGYSGMKTGDAYWANYPASAAWMMLHVADHFDYSQDLGWLKRTGYPLLLKPVAEFWLSQLQVDGYFKDGMTVVNPCDSPEHGPTTFGCTHYQQLLHSLFTNTLTYAPLVSDPSTNFTASLLAALVTLDKGLHIGSWGQIQEWRMDIDVENDTHRHLSNLVGWYPGSSISSYLNGYTNSTIQNAVATTLYSRGPGIADQNTGWQKVWRGACWARLNNTYEAYYELKLTIQENIVWNLFSMYSGKYTPFQIDANFGYVGNVLAMLVVDMPVTYGVEGMRTVVLGPAIPKEWGRGRVKGLRLRGGASVDFEWDAKGVVISAVVSGSGRKGVNVVNVEGTFIG